MHWFNNPIMRRFHQTCQYWLSNKNKNASWGLIKAQVLGPETERSASSQLAPFFTPSNQTSCRMDCLSCVRGRMLSLWICMPLCNPVHPSSFQLGSTSCLLKDFLYTICTFYRLNKSNLRFLVVFWAVWRCHHFNHSATTHKYKHKNRQTDDSLQTRPD